MLADENLSPFSSSRRGNENGIQFNDFNFRYIKAVVATNKVIYFFSIIFPFLIAGVGELGGEYIG